MLLSYEKVLFSEAGSGRLGRPEPGMAIHGPVSRAKPGLHRAVSTAQWQAFPIRRRVEEERAAVRRFVARVNALGPLSQASPELQARLLEEVTAVARCVDGSAELGAASGYDRRVLHDDPSGWSLAAIILRPGQQTHSHDHGSWGCAVTVQGVERNRRYVEGAPGNLVLRDEFDYPPGAGYIFDAVEVHQPIGSDPQLVTVALHFLAPAQANVSMHGETTDHAHQDADNAT